MSSVDHSLKVLADLQALATDSIQLIKHGISIGAVKQIMQIVSDGKDLISQAPQALPELKSLDSVAAAQIAEAAYNMVKAVITEIAS